MRDGERKEDKESGWADKNKGIRDDNNSVRGNIRQNEMELKTRTIIGSTNLNYRLKD